MRRRKATGERFGAIRREEEFGVGTIQGVARQLGVHRRLVREALNDAAPVPPPAPPRAKPRVAPVAACIEAIRKADRKAPRKPRHRAPRLGERRGRERPETPVAEATVRRSVRERKAQLGRLAGETFVPQHEPWGSEAQVDWYAATAARSGEPPVVPVRVIRRPASGAAFQRAAPRATPPAFLEAHELAFHAFGGVVRRRRADHLSAAVRQVVRGLRRDAPRRFVACRAHWRFAAVLCPPAEAHETGGVEPAGGRFRRTHWGPVPSAAPLADLNA